MLIPLYDDDSRLHKTAYVTLGLIIANVIAFLLQTDEWVYGYGAIPREILSGVDLVETATLTLQGEEVKVPQVVGPTPIYLTLITSMFMHGDWLHLLSNMLYLWIFGDNIEHRLGTAKYLVFYTASGIVAALTQMNADPNSYFPMIGASGAISGVLGAYLVLFPRNKVRVLFFYIFRFSVPALVLLGVWIGLQVLSGAGATEEDTVAYGAHVGGFVFGVLAGLWIRFTQPVTPEPRTLDTSLR